MNKGRHGCICATKNNSELSGKGDVVYIYLGEENSIVPGNTFSIYMVPRQAYNPAAGKRVVIQGTLIGKMVICEVEKNSATGIIMESSGRQR